MPVGDVADIFQLVVEATPDAIVLADAQGHILLVNARAEKLFGYDTGEMVGQPVEMLMPVRLRTAHRGHRSEYAEHVEVRRLGHGRNFFALRKDGSEVPVEIGLNPIETPEGTLTLSTILDTTERLRTETELRASELRYRRLFETAQDGILILDAENGMVMDVNPFLETLLGFSHEQFLGKAIWDLGFFKNIVANEDKFAELQQKEYVRYEDLPLETSDGRKIDVEFVSNVYLVSGGKVIQCNIRDITKRKLAETRLLESKRFLRSTLDALSSHIAILDERGTIVEVNAAWSRFADDNRFMGSSHGVGDNYLQVCDSATGQFSKEGAAVAEGIRVVMARKSDEFHLEYPCHSPVEKRWFIVRVTRFGGDGPVRVVVAHENISERKQTESLMLESRERLELATKSAHMGIWDWDVVTNELVWDAQMYRLYGILEDDFSGAYDAWLNGLHPEDRAQAEADIRDAVNSVNGFHAEFRVIWPGGEVRNIEAHALVKHASNGSAKRMIGVNWDITERKRAEDRFRRLVESNAQGVIFWNTSGAITGANDVFLQLTGYTREDLDGGLMNWIAMTPPDYAEEDRRCLREVAAKGVCPPFEKEYIRKDGTHVPVIIGAANYEDSPQEGFCFVLDLTERKKLELQFLRAQRMESIGTLAGGIAHDLNNVLSPIMMAIEVLRMRFPDAESLHLLDILSTSAQRGADMVRQVLSFARGVEGRRMEVQIRHLVQDMEKTVRDTFLKSIEMRTMLPNDLWTVVGDPTQLYQVLMNLCVNARDAMPHGGRLTISAENLMLDAHYARLNPEAKPGPYVFIQVEDTGSGIPPGILEKIFDPFFTTKEVGKGTGLGLSTSLAIIKSHGGFMRVYSEMGKGTKFHINLPARTEASAAAAEIAAELPRGHGELILVVDDEASVRLITQRTLETFGYRVLLAADGSEAVAIYATRKAEIAVVLTDMTMPVMDGLATIHVLMKLDPSVRIIAASGLSANSQIASLGVKHFLPKPYTAETLLKVLKEVLSQA